MHLGIHSFVCFLFYFGLTSGIETYYMDQQCGSTLDLTNPQEVYSMRMVLTNNIYYTTDLDCLVHIYAARDERLLLYFKTMDISNDCSKAWLELHDGYSLNDHYVPGLHGKQCGNMKLWKEYHTTRNELTLYFKSDRRSRYDNFDITITRYHTGRCRANEYRCGKGWCINNSLKCNNYNPCGAHSDCPLGPGAVVGIVIACAVFLVILFLCVMFVRRRGYQHTEGIIGVVPPPPTYGTPGEDYDQPVPQQYSPLSTRLYQGSHDTIPSAPPPPYSK